MESKTLKSTDPVTPLASVVITAYNLEKWLPRAVDSALKQRTSFPIEIVISDDCSTDATLRIAHSYRERYPNLIRVLERSKNVGVQRNTWETLEQCRGKYTAFLDADDCWTDPDKLMIQVELLESDPSVSVCCHYVRWITHDAEIALEQFPSIPAGRYGLDEIVRHNIAPTLSVVFRSGIHRQLPDWYFGFKSLSDWPLWVLAARTGDIVLIDRVMADYTLTPGSSFQSNGSLFVWQMEAEFYEHLVTILPAKWHRLVRSEKGKRYEAIAYLLRKQGDFSGSRRAAVKAFCSPSPVDNCGSKTKALLAALVREAEWRVTGATPAT